MWWKLREEPFYALQLEVKGQRSIGDSLRLFTEGEVLAGDNAVEVWTRLVELFFSPGSSSYFDCFYRRFISFSFFFFFKYDLTSFYIFENLTFLLSLF